MTLQPLAASPSRQLPQAAPVPRDLEFSYNPQDQLVMEPGTFVVPNVSQDLSTEQVALKGKLEPQDGKYVFDKKDVRFHGATAFAGVNRTLQIFTEAYGKPIEWSTGRQKLDVTPLSGQDFNAYYSRDDGGLFFFEGVDPKTGKSTFSADSGEIVGHETGHAILDAIRPGYFSAWSLDPGAFHESFGDVLAMLAALKDDRVVDQIVAETGGDLTKQNSVAALGEELGVAINAKVGKNVTGGDYTRNALNNFTWVDPKTLPPGAPPDKLARQVHSFSRLWTGAFYQVFTGIVKDKLSQGLEPKAALSAAADEGLKMYGRMMQQAPEGDFTFKDMANVLLKSENEGNGGKYSGLIRTVFTERKILPNEASMFEGTPQTPGAGTRRLSTVLEGAGFAQFQGAKVETLLSGEQAGMLEDLDAERNLQEQMQQLVAANEIKFTEPNQVVRTSDLFKPDGTPYTGVVRWVNGEMTIERVKVAH